MFLLPGLHVHASSWELPIQIRFYGHVFLEDKNTPLENMLIEIKKNEDIITSGRTNKDGTYDLVSDNRTDYVNLCVSSTEFSTIKNIDYCVVVKSFQGPGRIIDKKIEVREVEYSFFTNEKWENLNELLENEINNTETEEEYQKYEDIISEQKVELEIKELETKKTEELEKQKVSYRMPNNTEMSGPLDVMTIIGTITSESWSSLDLSRTTIEIYSHEWKMIHSYSLEEYKDFKIILEAWKNVPEKIYLHPLTMRIKNSQKQMIDGESIPLFQEEFRLINREINIHNIVLKPYQKNNIKQQFERANFPFISLGFIIFILITWSLIIIKNRKHNLVNF